jgi:protein involved in polysaccharide export with SLBB domain
MTTCKRKVQIGWPRSLSLLPAILLSLLIITGCSSRLPVTAPTDTAWLKDRAPANTPAYLLGTGDKLGISSARWQDLNVTVAIDSMGDIQYPYLGKVHAAGMTAEELRAALTSQLQDYYTAPHLTVNLLKERQRFAYILGEVFKPGPVPLNGETTLIDAIGMAGGATPDAAMQNVAFLRPTEKATLAAVLDLRSFQSAGDRQVIATRLQEKDVIYVPADAMTNVERFFIKVGNIARPLLDIERGILLYPDVEDVINHHDLNSAERRVVVIGN